MKVLITGATGFIGSHIVDALMVAGHDVIACVRDTKVAERRWPGVATIKADFSRDHEVADWLPCLKDVDIVINAVGIIREARCQTFEALHTHAPVALFGAAQQAGVKRVIQISALGADETAVSHYHLSKRAADQFLMTLSLDWAIARPSIVYGPGAKSMELFKAVAALPLVPLIDKGAHLVQPIHVDDLVLAILRLVDVGGQVRAVIPMVGPRPVSLRDIYAVLRRWLGLGPARFVSMPYWLALIFARLGGFMGNTPLTKEAVKMLQRGNTGDVSPFVERFGFTPIGFEDALSPGRARQSDRWHANLYSLRFILRYSVAFLWIFTGIVSAFVFPKEQSFAMLAQAGISGPWASPMLYGASLINLALGVATLTAFRLPLVGLLQIFLVVIYSTVITVFLPEYWLHPFGPISKNLPLIAATMVMIALEKW